MEKKNAWLGYSADEMLKLSNLNESYRAFLTESKTERLTVKNTILLAESAGYKNLKDLVAEGKKVSAGDKIYAIGMNKTVALFLIGEDSLENGMNILGAHIDSPRLDLKQVPLYEDNEFAYLDTHYYGGIKHYQWMGLPLAIYGVIAKKDGTVTEIKIGDREGDPVVGITDILPHLGKDQRSATVDTAFPGENLDILVGSCPLAGEEKEAVKA